MQRATFLTALRIAVFLLVASASAVFAQGTAPPSVGTPTTRAQTLDRQQGSSTIRLYQDIKKQDHTDQAYSNYQNHQNANITIRNETDGNHETTTNDPNQIRQNQSAVHQPHPYPSDDTGRINPGGDYVWNGQHGAVPNPTLMQPGYVSPGNYRDSGYPGPTDQEHRLLNPQSAGTVVSAWEYATIRAMATQQLAEEINDPVENVYRARAEATARQADAANNAAESSEGDYDASFDQMTQYLINVANEGSGTPTSSRKPFKDYSDAIWMVQQMYKQVYVPMAILLLLPGAILTQVKSVVSAGMIGSRDEDTQSPFTGIMRAMIAIFLIPATQLVVSYIIDTGNSVTDAVTQELERQGGLQSILDWAHQQTFHTDATQNQNYTPNITPDSSDPRQGQIAGRAEAQARFEDQTTLSTTMQQWFNTFNNVLSQGLTILNGFQLTMMCYLFLLGPIAGALFAWPAGVGKDLFKKVFAGWLDGVTILALWKFWWNICLLCMAIRLGSGYVTSQTDDYELFMFTAFMAILMFVPFNPFEFRPGEIVSHVLEKAQQQAGRAGQSGAGGGNQQGGSGTGAQGTGGGPVGSRHGRDG
jgi:hypothetical protein